MSLFSRQLDEKRKLDLNLESRSSALVCSLKRKEKIDATILFVCYIQQVKSYTSVARDYSIHLLMVVSFHLLEGKWRVVKKKNRHVSLPKTNGY